MEYSNLLIGEYTEYLSKKTSVPGGGSALALVSEIAASLAMMTANFTIGKKGYEGIENLVTNHLKTLAQIKHRVHLLIDQDAIAFSELMEAFKCGVNIEEKSLVAIEVPYQLYILTQEIEESAKFLKEHGNKNVASDASIAVDLCQSVYPGCLLNIKTNLSSISDDRLKEKYLKLF